MHKPVLFSRRRLKENRSSTDIPLQPLSFNPLPKKISKSDTFQPFVWTSFFHKMSLEEKPTNTGHDENVFITESEMLGKYFQDIPFLSETTPSPPNSHSGNVESVSSDDLLKNFIVREPLSSSQMMRPNSSNESVKESLNESLNGTHSVKESLNGTQYLKESSNESLNEPQSLNQNLPQSLHSDIHPSINSIHSEQNSIHSSISSFHDESIQLIDSPVIEMASQHTPPSNRIEQITLSLQQGSLLDSDVDSNSFILKYDIHKNSPPLTSSQCLFQLRPTISVHAKLEHLTGNGFLLDFLQKQNRMDFLSAVKDKSMEMKCDGIEFLIDCIEKERSEYYRKCWCQCPWGKPMGECGIKSHLFAIGIGMAHEPLPIHQYRFIKTDYLFIEQEWREMTLEWIPLTMISNDFLSPKIMSNIMEWIKETSLDHLFLLKCTMD